jgi:hypothetical protein
MSPVGFEPMIAAGERPWTYAVDRAATGTGILDDIGGKERGVSILRTSS